MNDLAEAQNPAQATRETQTAFLLQKAPYLAVLLLALLGVAYTSIAGKPLYGYWEVLALAVGVACVVIGWRAADDRHARRRIVVRQALHWAAFLLAMTIIMMPSVNSFLNGPATGLALMLLLALGTFVAGIYVSVDIAILGIALALAVPAIAWLKKSALLLILLGLVIWVAASALWPRFSSKISFSEDRL